MRAAASLRRLSACMMDAVICVVGELAVRQRSRRYESAELHAVPAW